MPKIVRPVDCQPARALWFDRKKYVTINFMVQKSKDLQVDIQENKMILSCKSEEDVNIYNEIYFYDRVQIHDSRERQYDRTINVILRKIKENVAWPRLTKDPAKPSWLSVDFDNWRDWEQEEEEGMAEYGEYMDMLKDMTKKGEPPAMDDLDDLDFSTTVVSCSLAEMKLESNGKKEKVTGFNVTLKDTILFPEGGGQPDDRGTIGGVPVLRVMRQRAEAVHFVDSALEVGSTVQLKVDWERRFDHMQQHSGQHLITALADHIFGYKTTSWELGRQRSTIELDTSTMNPGEVEAIESAVNEKIRAGIPVTVKLLSLDDPTVQQVRSRGLPDDHVGPIRIIDIEGVDANMCCGTHVSNLRHLQVIKILGTEKGKKNKINLIFLAGNRVLKYAEKSYSTERSLTALLKTGADDHVQAVEKLQNTVKGLQKSNLNLLRDMAVLIAHNFKNDPNRGKLFCLHRKDGDNEFMNIIANEISTEDTIVFLTVGEEKGPGLFLLAGPVDVVDKFGSRVAELLKGKGAGKKGRFQGKANCMGYRAEVEALLQEHSCSL
ncbi:alanyl-tRNA editing protein Aarsd1-like isoform X3 [Arapaima gigas]